MALEHYLTLNSGINVTNAYSRIEIIEGGKDQLDIVVMSYLNQSAIQENKEPLAVVRYTFVPNIGSTSLNFFVQGYEHLKTLPGYEGATDILEENQSIA